MDVFPNQQDPLLPKWAAKETFGSNEEEKAKKEIEKILAAAGKSKPQLSTNQKTTNKKRDLKLQEKEYHQ